MHGVTDDPQDSLTVGQSALTKDHRHRLGLSLETIQNSTAPGIMGIDLVHNVPGEIGPSVQNTVMNQTKIILLDMVVWSQRQPP